MLDSVSRRWRWDYVFHRAPLSLNNAYPSGKGGRFLSAEMKAFKAAITTELTLHDRARGKPPEVPYYLATWVYCFPRLNSLPEDRRLALQVRPDGMFHKNGQLQRKDISNYFKAAEDTLFSYLAGPDDRQVLSLHGYRRVIPDRCTNARPFFLLFLSPEILDGLVCHGQEMIDLDEWIARAHTGRL